ncbi:hypothetical protein Tco_1493354 [Tanacetum coccineum]
MLEAIGKEGVNRFATSFLTLRLMFASDEWTQSKWAKTKNGKLSIFHCNEPILLERGKLMLERDFSIHYRPILDIIDSRSKGRLDSLLHLTAYLLNPYYFFKDESIKDDVMVSDAVFKCLEKFFYHDFERQDQVSNIELPKYKRKQGDFGRILAAKGCLENNRSYC